MRTAPVRTCQVQRAYFFFLAAFLAPFLAAFFVAFFLAAFFAILESPPPWREIGGLGCGRLAGAA